MAYAAPEMLAKNKRCNARAPLAIARGRALAALGEAAAAVQTLESAARCPPARAT